MTEEEAKEKIQELSNVSRETMDRLEIYANLLERWNPKINLVSKATLHEKWQRHFLDSAQLIPHIHESAGKLVDIGSGAGFAGLVVASIAHQTHPNLSVTLIEADTRKCAFMRTAAREMGIEAQIITQRIEEAANLGADIVSARALAPISMLLTYARQILAPTGHCLFLKGEACDNELEIAAESWDFKVEKSQSITHDQGVIVKLTGIQGAN
ncbi:ribosomal RNA small subunit methyltransferase G [Amylibacter marinus]|uniref:Ribosomal RNA small subunit methyltransferase G n=1 Tax=Amylibacter marinus TaxID=1475483 RepID=A0ABQ5VWL0_9RHOB|nr:16S rRNA (guanine(527)-N(7))-methyltransferase RsmG [Amylibacter marinus]GLQ35524.1 ribosomal RNA small subunit methyltransferase G [Amylibacter marinus]